MSLEYTKDELLNILTTDVEKWNELRRRHRLTGDPKIDLKEADLLEANLRGADLSNVDLSNSILRDADLRGVNFCDSNLSGADLMGANLHKAVLAHVDLSNVYMPAACLYDTDLSKAQFINTNVAEVTFGPVLRNPSRTSHFTAVRSDGCYGSPMFKRFIQDQAYLEEFSFRHKFIFWLWWITCYCGQSFIRWACFSSVIALIFSVLFWQMNEAHFILQEGMVHKNFGTYLYYSVVTFTTLGFGDVTPKTNVGMLCVSCEVIIGYIMLGGLISIFANKLARRS